MAAKNDARKTPAPPRGPGNGRNVCETLHALAAGLWLGSLVMAGVTAGVLFSTMRTLEPAFGRFAAFDGDQSNLGAGFIQNRVFLALDVVQFAAASITLAVTILLLAAFGLTLRRVSSGLRLFALGGAILLTSYQLLVLGPRMQDNAHAYWAAAEAGETDRAILHRDAFNADHPTARNVLGATALCVSLLLAAGVWSAASNGSASRDDQPNRPRGELEEPALARGRRTP